MVTNITGVSSVIHLIVQLIKSIFDNCVPVYDTIIIIQQILQKIIPIPLILNQDFRFEWNYAFRKRKFILFHDELSSLPWSCGKILIHFTFVIISAHLLRLITTPSLGNASDMALYVLAWVIWLEGVIAITTLEQSANDFAFLLNELLNITMTMRMSESLSVIIFMGKQVDIAKFAAMAASAAMTVIPLVALFLPLIVSKDPANLIVSSVFAYLDINPTNKLTTQILAALLLGPTAAIGSVAVLQAILVDMMLIIVCLNVVRSSYSVSLKMMDKGTHRTRFNSINTNRLNSPQSRRNLLIFIPQGKRSLWECLKRYNQLVILFEMANTCEAVYIPVLIFVGIVLCITPLYILIKLRNETHITLLIACFIFFLAVAFVTWFLLCMVGQISKESDEFLRRCRKRVKSRYERARLAAVSHIHARIGDMGNIHPGTQLTVFNIILNYTVTVVLL
ncbi:unnamed protein product [Orchesella dallaii]|uniref:Odorant receptor n=1 Tax=Orchesella dallaii TaxID=48710 RepID=A0ABP1RCY5_9HEXA